MGQAGTRVIVIVLSHKQKQQSSWLTAYIWNNTSEYIMYMQKTHYKKHCIKYV